MHFASLYVRTDTIIKTNDHLWPLGLVGQYIKYALKLKIAKLPEIIFFG